MHITCSSCQARQPTAAMIRISAGLRNINVRAVVNGLLVKKLPSSSSSSSSFASADFYSSAIALRDRKENSSFTERRRNTTYTSPASAPLLEVSAGGGPRPKKPRVWKTKTKRGSVARSEKLLDVVNQLSNTKEDLYGTLDAWIAWDLEFPLIAVKKALKTLQDQEEWRRIIQVSKWMLDKGQGKTLATYQLLLQAFDHEGRVEEAEVLWEKLLGDNQQSIPRIMFAQMIAMYDRYDKKKELLKVFADMEELQVKPDPATVERVVRAYSYYGYHEVGQALLERQSVATTAFRYIKGRLVEVRRQRLRGVAGEFEVQGNPGFQTNDESQKRLATEIIANPVESPRLDTGNEQEERPGLETSNKFEDGQRLVAGKAAERAPNFETNDFLEIPKIEINTQVPQVPQRSRFVIESQVKSDGDLRATVR